MVDPGRIRLAAVLHVQRCDPEVLQEGCVIRSGAQRLQQQVPAFGGRVRGRTDVGVGHAVHGLGQRARPQACLHADTGLRVDHRGGDLVQQVLHRVAAAGDQETPRVLV